MRSGRPLAIAYYGGLGLLLALILTKSLSDLLPGSIAGHVSRNSEGLLLALALSAWIQYVRPRIAAAPREWMVTGGSAAVCLTLALLLLLDDVPTSLRTLNEAFFALAVLLPYVQLRRPLPRAAWLVPAIAVVAPIVGADSGIAVTLAETFAFLLLVPLALDLGDRAILEPERRRRPLAVLGWVVVVVLVPVVLHLIRPNEPQNLGEELARYLSRTTEAYVAVVLLHAYFSFLLPALSGARPGDRLVAA